MQQGVKTDATCNIQQCWELLAQGFTHCVKKQQTACSLPFFLLKIGLALISASAIVSLIAARMLRFRVQ